MRLIFTAAAALIATPAVAQDQQKLKPSVVPYEFQGAALDTDFEALSDKLADASCTQEGEVRVCDRSSDTLFGSPASISYKFKQYDGAERLFEISVVVIRSFAVASLRTGLVSKWGKPDRPTITGSVWENAKFSLSFDTLTNGAVAHYENKSIAQAVEAANAKRAASEL